MCGKEMGRDFLGAEEMVRQEMGGDHSARVGNGGEDGGSRRGELAKKDRASRQESSGAHLRAYTLLKSPSPP